MSDHDFDLDGLMEELTDRAEEVCQDVAEDVINDFLDERLDDAVRDALLEVLPEAVRGCLAGYEFVLKDGTLVRPLQRLRVLSPDGSRLLECNGGLRVDGTSLIVQTGFRCWDLLAAYPNREAATAALRQVLEAMEAGEKLLKLS